MSIYCVVVVVVIAVVKYVYVVVTNVACTRQADIVLALDQSTSIVALQPDYSNWYVHVLGFAKNIASAFPISRNLTRVGLLKFSHYAEIVFYLNTYGDRESLMNAIGNVDISGGETNIAAALRAARLVMFSPSNGARPAVPEILILLSDGIANTEERQTLNEANLTKAANITIFTVGVTNRVDQDQLRQIASTPDKFFYVSHFTQLNSVLQQLLNITCVETARLTTTTTTPSTTTSTTTTTTQSTTTYLSLSLKHR